MDVQIDNVHFRKLHVMAWLKCKLAVFSDEKIPNCPSWPLGVHFIGTQLIESRWVNQSIREFT